MNEWKQPEFNGARKITIGYQNYNTKMEYDGVVELEVNDFGILTFTDADGDTFVFNNWDWMRIHPEKL